MNRLILTTITILLAGCNVTTRPDGTTQQRLDPNGIFQTWDMAVDRSTALEIEYIAPGTTAARKQEIDLERGVERTMFQQALDAVLKVKPTIEITIVVKNEAAVAPVTQAVQSLFEDSYRHADGTVSPPASTRPDAR